MSVLLLFFRLFVLELIPSPLILHVLLPVFNMTHDKLSIFVAAYDRYPDIRVPPIQELKSKIKQIRDYQQLMDQMEYEYYEDDDFSLINLIFGKKKLPQPLKIPLLITPSTAITNSTPDQLKDTVGPPWPTRPTEKPGSSLVIVDISRSIVQSAKSFGRWLDNLIGWKLF